MDGVAQVTRRPDRRASAAGPARLATALES